MKAAGVLLLVLMLVPACVQRGEPVGRLLVEGARREPLLAAARAAIASDPHFHLADQGATLRFRARQGGDDFLEVEVSRESAGRQTLRASASGKSGELPRIVRQALAGLVGEQSLIAQPSSKLIALLSKKDVPLVVIQELGERHEESALDPLLALFRRSLQRDQERAAAALGALGRIGDPRAASVIADSIPRQNPVFQQEAVGALAQLPGPTAEGCLFVLSRAAATPQVREAARVALEARGDVGGLAGKVAGSGGRKP